MSRGALLTSARLGRALHLVLYSYSCLPTPRSYEYYLFNLLLKMLQHVSCKSITNSKNHLCQGLEEWLQLYTNSHSHCLVLDLHLDSEPR